MNNQHAFSQNKMNIADQGQLGSLAGLTSGITKAWEAIMSLMQTAAAKSEDGTSVDPNDGATLALGHIMPEYSLSLVLYPSNQDSIVIKNYENEIVTAINLPINGTTDLYINKVFVYKNMVLCSVKGTDFSAVLKEANHEPATDYIKQYILPALIPNEQPVPNFMWSTTAWSDLGIALPKNEFKVEIVAGASGGGAM